MIIMTLEGIGISFGDTVLLQNVTQGIEDYDRIGVIGINGTGKSTLLAIIAGALQPDEGKIISRNGLKISYLPQKRCPAQRIHAGHFRSTDPGSGCRHHN